MSLTQDSVEYHSTDSGLNPDTLGDYAGAPVAHDSQEGTLR